MSVCSRASQTPAHETARWKLLLLGPLGPGAHLGTQRSSPKDTVELTPRHRGTLAGCIVQLALPWEAGGIHSGVLVLIAESLGRGEEALSLSFCRAKAPVLGSGVGRMSRDGRNQEEVQGSMKVVNT